MIDAARYLERRAGYEEKAVLLYHRAGQLNTAINLAFETKQYGALVTITRDDFDNEIDPVLIKKCADFFLQDSQFGKAVEILARGKQVQLYLAHSIVYGVERFYLNNYC